MRTSMVRFANPNTRRFLDFAAIYGMIELKSCPIVIE